MQKQQKQKGECSCYKEKGRNTFQYFDLCGSTRVRTADPLLVSFLLIAVYQQSALITNALFHKTGIVN